MNTSQAIMNQIIMERYLADKARKEKTRQMNNNILKGNKNILKGNKNMFVGREIVAELREEYPIGCRVELLEMEDKQAPKIGTMGTVVGVDDIGSLLVHWDNGSSLNVIYGVDKVRKVI